MAVNRSMNCRNCGAVINVDDDREFVYCQYCGTKNDLGSGYGQRERYFNWYEYRDGDDYCYRGPFDKDIELERMRQKERESIRDNQLLIAVFVFILLMFIFGSIFGF